MKGSSRMPCPDLKTSRCQEANSRYLDRVTEKRKEVHEDKFYKYASVTHCG